MNIIIIMFPDDLFTSSSLVPAFMKPTTKAPPPRTSTHEGSGPTFQFGFEPNNVWKQVYANLGNLAGLMSKEVKIFQATIDFLKFNWNEEMLIYNSVLKKRNRCPFQGVNSYKPSNYCEKVVILKRTINQCSLFCTHFSRGTTWRNSKKLWRSMAVDSRSVSTSDWRRRQSKTLRNSAVLCETWLGKPVTSLPFSRNEFGIAAFSTWRQNMPSWWREGPWQKPTVSL